MKSYKLIINGEKYEARVEEYTETHAKITVNGTDYSIQFEDDKSSQMPKLAQEKAVPIAPGFSSGFEPGTGELRAPIPGVIVKIHVSEGDKIKKGQTLVSLEAMKMESEIAAPADGEIVKIYIKERSPVQEGDLMMMIKGEQVKEKPLPPPVSKPSQAAPCAPQTAEKIMRAPLPGLVIDVLVQEGQSINTDSTVLILEAMKMESEIYCTLVGKISKVYVHKGDSIQEGDPLIEVEG